jgi:hypothetical protein
MNGRLFVCIATRFVPTVRIPRDDARDLMCVPGNELGIRIGGQSVANRWVWDEMSERNYMMSVRLR